MNPAEVGQDEKQQGQIPCYTVLTTAPLITYIRMQSSLTQTKFLDMNRNKKYKIFMADCVASLFSLLQINIY